MRPSLQTVETDKYEGKEYKDGAMLLDCPGNDNLRPKSLNNLPCPFPKDCPAQSSKTSCLCNAKLDYYRENKIEYSIPVP